MRHLVTLSLLTFLSPGTSQVLAFQNEAPGVPVIPDGGSAYEAEIPEDTDPLKGDAAAESRVQSDATQIAEAAGDELGDQLAPLLRTLFDGSADDDARLETAAELRRLVSHLDANDLALLSVKRQVERRAGLVAAGISGLKANPDNADGRALMNDFMIRVAIDSEGSNREAYTNEARRIYRLIKQSHPELHSSIHSQFSGNYYNYNLHFIISEPMLSMLISDHQTESGSVADCILGAWVTGCQVTDTMVRADIKPSLTTGMFNIIADGRTCSDTQGRKSPATIYTKGNHGFHINKSVYFDGKSLTSSPADMSVNANNRTVGVSTDFDRIPILGGIARSIARKEAQKKHAQSEAIAAQKLADQALPRFENEVRQKFAEANDNLQNNVLRDLESRGIAPESYSLRSSETHLAMSTRTIGHGTLAGSPPPSAPAPRKGIALQAHESVINAALSTLDLAGPTTPVELIEKIEAALEDFTDRPVHIPRPEPKEKQTDFDFEAEDAIRVRFDENRVVLLFRTGFYQYNKGEERPAEPTLDKQVFEIPIEVTFENGEVIMTPPPLDNLKEFGAKIKQRSADSSQSKGVAALRRAVQARKIAQQLVTAVFRTPDTPDASDKRVPAEVKVLVSGSERVRLRVTKFNISDGWLTAVLNK